MKLRKVPAGEFLMGSPGSEPGRRDHERQRQVVIDRAFFIAITEVTQGQWWEVMHTKPWSRRPYARDGHDYPVTYVSWNEAVAFCRKLSRIEQRTYRLPTEAEWEYACRAGTTTAFSYGSDPARLVDYGWIGRNTFDVDQRYAHRVARKKPNSWGLYDMQGNNWEWCSDWYSEPTADRDIVLGGPPVGERRVIRGGSWHGLAKLCRSASRFNRDPAATLNDLGFRVVLEVQSNLMPVGM